MTNQLCAIIESAVSDPERKSSCPGSGQSRPETADISILFI